MTNIIIFENSNNIVYRLKDDGKKNRFGGRMRGHKVGRRWEWCDKERQERGEQIQKIQQSQEKKFMVYFFCLMFCMEL